MKSKKHPVFNFNARPSAQDKQSRGLINLKHIVCPLYWLKIMLGLWNKRPMGHNAYLSQPDPAPSEAFKKYFLPSLFHNLLTFIIWLHLSQQGQDLTQLESSQHRNIFPNIHESCKILFLILAHCPYFHFFLEHSNVKLWIHNLWAKLTPRALIWFRSCSRE